MYFSIRLFEENKCMIHLDLTATKYIQHALWNWRIQRRVNFKACLEIKQSSPEAQSADRANTAPRDRYKDKIQFDQVEDIILYRFTVFVNEM